MAAQGDELVQRAVKNKIAYLTDSITESFVRQSANLGSCGGRLKDWDQDYYFDPDSKKAEILKQMADDLKVAGMEKPDGNLFEKTDQALAKLKGELLEAVKGWKCEPDGDLKADAFITKAYGQAYKGSKVVKNYRKSTAWEVTVNHLGVPQYRAMRGMVVFKVDGETWCRSQEYSYFQNYEGRAYGKDYFENPPESGWTTFCSCP
jgi:hypothetical protein